MEQGERSQRHRFLKPAFQYEGQIRACLLRHTRDRSIVNDLLQETWIRLLLAGQSETQYPASIQAYALQVAKHIALDWLRRRKIVPILLVENYDTLAVLGDGSPQPDQIVNGRQELERLVHIAGTMPPRQRHVFTLKKVYELSQEEIAIRLGIKENTVESHLRKAAQWLARKLVALDEPQVSREVGRVRTNP